MKARATGWIILAVGLGYAMWLLQNPTPRASVAAPAVAGVLILLGEIGFGRSILRHPAWSTGVALGGVTVAAAVLLAASVPVAGGPIATVVGTTALVALAVVARLTIDRRTKRPERRGQP